MLSYCFCNNNSRKVVVNRLVKLRSYNFNGYCKQTHERKKRLHEHVWTKHVNHKENILKSDNIKDAHIYSLIHKLNGSQFGKLIENYIIETYNYKKTNDHNKGDCYKNGYNYEIKTSLGGKTGKKFNYVQIRVSHMISYYILMAYYLDCYNLNDEGELYIFKVPNHEIKKLILDYGEYSHGSKKNNGEITLKSLNSLDNRFEYSLRPKYGDKCWNELQLFKISESDL